MAFLFDWAVMEPDEYAQVTPSGSVVQLGERNYLRIDGQGDESGLDFQQQAAAILTLGQYLSEAPQHGIDVPELRNFVHYPILVNWLGNLQAPHQQYQMLMKQPNFMPKAAVVQAINQLKGQQPLIADIQYERFEEGLAAQVGYSDISQRSQAAKQLQGFIEDGSFNVDETANWHRELYLNDITKLPRDQWQLVLRQSIKFDNHQRADDYPIIVN